MSEYVPYGEDGGKAVGGGSKGEEDCLWPISVSSETALASRDINMERTRLGTNLDK